MLQRADSSNASRAFARGDRERCLEAGMDDYISKPINAHELRELLDKYIDPGETAPVT